MAQENDFRPPIATPSDRPGARITQPDIHAVNQPWGAIPSVMAKIGKPGFALMPIAGRSDTGRGGKGSR